MEGVGFIVASDLEIWLGHPGKVLGVREDWANTYPNSHVALVKAILEGCRYCADPANHEEIRHLLADRKYLSTKVEYIELTDPDGTNTCSLDRPMYEYGHLLFAGEGVNRPSRTEHLWMMTQMARWGDIPMPRNWVEILERVCRVSVFSIAARELGLSDIKYLRGQIQLFDGIPFDAEDPLGYLNKLEIKRNVTTAEVHLNAPKILAA
jgi:bicarbonate transport system ATP-binding protein